MNRKLNLDMEQQFLGLALNHPEFVLDIITPSAFADENHRILWTAMLCCKRDCEFMDVHVLVNYLEQHRLPGKDLEPYIRDLAAASVIPPRSGKHYAALLHRQGWEAKLENGLASIARSGASAAEKKDKLLALAKECDLIVPDDDQDTTAKSAVREALDEIERLLDSGGLPGISTGFDQMDRVTGGFHRSDLTVVGARPSVGKTALACNFALAAGPETRVAFVSAEQPRKQIAARMISIVSHVAGVRMRNPSLLEDREWEMLGSAAVRLSERDIEIFSKSRPSIGHVQDWVASAAPDIVFVDYIQRMRGNDPRAKPYEQVSQVTQGLKDLALDLDIPVVALAQINREGGANGGMDNLKGSGDIEQEADSVFILRRDQDNTPDVAELELEKNRHGPRVRLALQYHGPSFRFSELAPAAPSGDVQEHGGAPALGRGRSQGPRATSGRRGTCSRSVPR